VLLGLEVAAVVCAYVAFVNLFIGAFNLLPGYPLDGGRMLRAVVWGLRRNFAGASRIAGYAGRVVSAALMVGGLVMVLGGMIGGAWLAFLGFFLWSSAMPRRAPTPT
jgi:Zn-dependent protease